MNDTPLERTAALKAGIEMACPTHEQLAKTCGVSPASLYSWKTGRRIPRPAARRAIADAMRQQARALWRLADQIAPEGRR